MEQLIANLATVDLELPSDHLISDLRDENDRLRDRIKLLEQNNSLKEELEQHYSIEQEEDNQTLFVNKESIYFKLWILLTFIVVFITIKQMMGITISSINNSVSNSIYST